MIPELVTLVIDVNRGFLGPGGSPDDEPLLRERLGDMLQRADYLARLERLSVLSSDHRNATRFVEEAVRWARLRALALIGFLLASGYPAVWIAIEGQRFPVAPLIPCGIVATISLVLAGVFVVQETAFRNRIAALSSHYV